ncbi:unnamed protein product [Timema podura]|uniref:Uncharacterized protein n=1 Tax=Timema podura TaxID=61482 RepID=A0ABN7P6C7_TIMPD|nr:unnamed protein product [Timema podura]
MLSARGRERDSDVKGDSTS